MTKQMKYPVEAFALALVMFSSGMKEAMIVGIALIFGDVLQCVLRENFETKYAQSLSGIGAVITSVAMWYMQILIGVEPDVRQVIGFAVLGVLLMKHTESRNWEEAVDYNQVLLADACAYGIYVLFAVIREFLAGAMIFGFEMPEVAIVSSVYGKPMFGLIIAGLAIALINLIVKSRSEANAALWVCIPTILLEVPFIWNNVEEWIGSLIGIFTVGVIYLTFRKKLVFSDTDQHVEGISVELVTLGIIYMIFSLL